MTTRLRGGRAAVRADAQAGVPAQRSRDGGTSAIPGRSDWQRRYTRAVIAVDIAAVSASAGLYGLWGHASRTSLLIGAVVVIALAVAALGVTHAWDPAIFGQGSLEFTRLMRSFIGAAVVIALVGLALQRPQARPWVFAVLPIAGLLAATGRLVLRKRLHRRRHAGKAMARVLAVGADDAIAEFIDRTRRAPHHGWLVAGACTPAGAGPDGAAVIEDVPLVGDLDSVAALTRDGRYDVVAVVQLPGFTPLRLQQLAWDLEPSGTELVVDPGLMEIAGPRLHLQNVDGLTFFRLTHPTFEGVAKLLKGAIDRAAAALILLAISPILLGFALAVRSDGGPAFFRQIRVGKGGREFRMLKFRSMVVDAEAQRPALHVSNEATGPLFKMHHDPRITPLGRVLRRYSIDELPQLFNVLGGSMSLVGPRPPLPSEVTGYERAARRRLLVKPGMTGLWQVSGRSDLSWEASVRLDLRYVENWTLALDVQILLKTVRAVLGGNGAY